MRRIQTLVVGLLCLAPSTAAQHIAVYGDVVHTMAGDPIQDGVVLVREGKIAAVQAAAGFTLPEDTTVLRAAVVTPGLIDAHATVGLTGLYNQDQDQDQLELSEPIQPELRAIDSYNARETLIAWVAGFGVTTIHTGHAPGGVVTGQTMIAKTTGGTLEEAVMVPAAMIAATLGDDARAREEKQSPGTRSKAVAMLRQALVDAQEYQRKQDAEDADKRPERNLRHEALARCLSGELPLLVTAHRHHDILTALRLAEEFGFPLVLDGAAEAYLLIDEIEQAGVPVIIHPAMTRSGGATSETANVSFETAALLHRSGILFAQQSGYESYVPKVRVVLFEAAIAGRYGLAFEDNLASITIDAARLLGIDDRVGSLEVGKDGDIALYDGNPFEYTTHCVGTVIEGRLISQEAR